MCKTIHYRIFIGNGHIKKLEIIQLSLNRVLVKETMDTSTELNTTQLNKRLRKSAFTDMESSPGHTLLKKMNMEHAKQVM